MYVVSLQKLILAPLVLVGMGSAPGLTTALHVHVQEDTQALSAIQVLVLHKDITV